MTRIQKYMNSYGCAFNLAYHEIEVVTVKSESAELFSVRCAGNFNMAGGFSFKIISWLLNQIEWTLQRKGKTNSTFIFVFRIHCEFWVNSRTLLFAASLECNFVTRPAMGVKGLWQLLECVGRPITLESLENKVLGVGILWSLYIDI